MWLRVVPACDWAVLVMGGILSEHLPQLYTLLDCLRALQPFVTFRNAPIVLVHIYMTTFMTDNSNNKLNC